MRKLLFAMAVGAALAWLFDPDMGSRRRESLRRKLEQQGWVSSPPRVAAVPNAVTDYSAAGIAAIP